MKALKGLVVGMGILIFVILGVIAVTLYNRAAVPEGGPDGGPEDGPGKTAGVAGNKLAGPSLPAFGPARLGLPAGAALLGMDADGGRLLLRVRHADGGEWIHVVDLATGTTLGRIEVTPGK